MKQTSHMYTHISFLLSLPAHHPTPLGRDRAPSWAPCARQQLPTGYSTHGHGYMSVPPSQFVSPPLLLLCVHMSIPHVSVSIPALQIGPSVLFWVCVCVLFKTSFLHTDIGCETGFPTEMNKTQPMPPKFRLSSEKLVRNPLIKNTFTDYLIIF